MNEACPNCGRFHNSTGCPSIGYPSSNSPPPKQSYAFSTESVVEYRLSQIESKLELINSKIDWLMAKMSNQLDELTK